MRNGIGPCFYYKFMIIYKQVCESLEKTENSKFDERKLGRETVRSWARKKE